MPKKGLNILRAQLAPQTSWDKIYKWMLGTARIIIIVVEVVVMAAFAVRIFVDTQGGELDKAITSKNNELSAYAAQETNFRMIQRKGDRYRDLWLNSSNVSEYMNFVDKIIGNTSGELSIRMENDEISIRGILPVSQINRIESDLKIAADNSSEGSAINFRSVELAEINTRSNSATQEGEFLIRVILIIPEEKRIL